jgi:hypothetical protein
MLRVSPDFPLSTRCRGEEADTGILFQILFAIVPQMLFE